MITQSTDHQDEKALQKPVNEVFWLKFVAEVFFFNYFSSVIFNLLNWEIRHFNFVSGEVYLHLI